MEVRTQPYRLSDRGRLWFDRAVASSVVLISIVPAAILAPIAVVLSLVQTVPLFWRRQRPVAVFGVVASAMALQAVLLVEPLASQLAFPIALYSLARYGTARWGWIGLGVGLIGSVVASVVWMAIFDNVSFEPIASYVMTIGTIVLASWALGTLGRTRQAYVDTLEERNEQLRRESEQRAELAAAEERARIAREMHDVVAHGLSMIVVQADGARYAAASDPSAVTPTLATIAEAARHSLTEMRRLLGLLRAGEDTALTVPQPTLADLGELIEQTQAAGTNVRAVLPAPDRPIPDGVALTTYRIVQEALSNVRRHAGPQANAQVEVRVTEHEVTIEVVDDGRGAAAESDGHGLGLRGMRERVGAHGGTLETGPLVGGGFRVAARLPW